MKLIDISLGDWGLQIETYLGDVYFPNRTLILVIVIAALIMMETLLSTST